MLNIGELLILIQLAPRQGQGNGTHILLLSQITVLMFLVSNARASARGKQLNGSKLWRAQMTHVGLCTSLISCVLHFSTSRKSAAIVFVW